MRGTDDRSERDSGAGVGAPEDEAGGHFEVENSEGPVLDEVNGVGGRGCVFGA